MLFSAHVTALELLIRDVNTTTVPIWSLLSTSTLDPHHFATTPGRPPTSQSGSRPPSTVPMEATTAPPTDEHYQHFYDLAQLITGLVFYPTFCIFGLTGNILSILVLRGRKTQSPTNAFLIALSVSDGIKLANDLCYFLVILLLQTHPTSGERLFGWLYPYAHYFFNMSICITAWITVTLAAERYVLVCHAARAKQMCNMTRAHVTIAMVFVSMTVLTIPSALRYRTVYEYAGNSSHEYSVKINLTALWTDENFVVSYTWTQNLLRSVVPLTVLCTLNCFIVQALRRTSRRNQPSPGHKMTQRHRITLMLVSVIVVFIVCVTPDAIMSTVFGFGYYEGNYLVRGVREITDLLLTVNSASNFLLYCAFNNVFRHRFRALFLGACRRRGKASRREDSIGTPHLLGVTYFVQSSVVVQQRNLHRVREGVSRSGWGTSVRDGFSMENVAQAQPMQRLPVTQMSCAAVTWIETNAGTASCVADGANNRQVTPPGTSDD